MGQMNPAGGSKPQKPIKSIPFGKYLLLDRIAMGGMAEVYTAKSFGIEGFEKIIAVKRILPTMAEDQDFITMFIDEAKIAGHLTHANIVPIYELGKIGESHYIAMEYVWGKDLLQVMNRFRKMRRHMPPVMAAWICSKMLEGLDYAHRKRDRHGRPMRIIHRDVSPQNCLVSYEGQVKMIDFGIAKAASRNTKTQAGVLKGKFGYMSPEQVRGMSVDHRSDVFAASTCLHEMLTGERLFVGESDFSTLEKVRNADVVAPSGLIAEMPPELEEIVMKGLAREPDDRWQTAGEMQEELQRFIALQRPPFGTSKLNTWMRTAFAPELAKEKARLDSFAKLAHPGLGAAAMPQPAAPAAPTPAPAKTFPAPRAGALTPIDPTPELEDEEDELRGEATMITTSPFDEMMEAQQQQNDGEELVEQATQIFFTMDDLEELNTNDLEPVDVDGAVPPAASIDPMTPRPTLPLPDPQALAAAQNEGATPLVDVFAPPGTPNGAPQRNLATVDVLPDGVTPTPAASGGGKGKLFLGLGLAAVLLLGMVGVGAAVLLNSGPDTGTISVRVAPEGTVARVFVDGDPVGNTPLLLEHVPVGGRALEVRAEGFETVRQEIPVSAGSTAMLQLALQRSTSAPLIAAAAPPAAPADVRAPPTEPAQPQPTAAAPPEEPAQPVPTAEAERPEPQPRLAAATETRTAEAPRRPQRTSRSSSETRTRTRTPRERTPQRVPSRTASSRSGRSSGGGESGTLTINTMPWARVFVDGRDTGRNTPVRNLRVPAGAHTIGLRTNDGTMHTVQVTIAPGASERIVRQL